MSKADRRIARTKKSIYEALTNLLMENDIKDITINDIAERADINRGTIYRHYTDKFDLFDHWLKDELKYILSDFVRKKGSSIDLRETFHVMFLYFEDHFDFYASMMLKQRGTSFRERILDLLHELISIQIGIKNLQNGLNEDMVAYCMTSSLISAVEWWLKNRMTVSADEMAEQLFAFFELNNASIENIYIKTPV